MTMPSDAAMRAVKQIVDAMPVTANALSLRECDRLANKFAAIIDREMQTEITQLRLRVALQAMLDTHGMPVRDEWINDAAFEHAKAVDAQARAALYGQQP